MQTPTLQRRSLLATAAFAGLTGFTGLCALHTTAAHAQTPAPKFPTEPVKLIVTYPPGGTVDAVARIIAPKLSERWGQPVVVDNRAGGGGLIGAGLVVKAPADGHTLMVDASNHSQNPALRKTMPFDTFKDLASVSLLVKVPNMLVVHPQYKAKTVKELVALAKAQPGSVNYASSGNGSSPHLAAELFAMQTGTQMTHIAYKGGGPALVDVMSGQVPVFFASTASALQHIRAGKLLAVAISGDKRSPVLPETPTFAEAGVPGYEAYEWNAVFAPAGVPEALRNKISQDIAAVLGDREVNARLIALSAEVIGSTPAELEKFRQAEVAKWSRLAKQANITLD